MAVSGGYQGAVKKGHVEMHVLPSTPNPSCWVW